jgi:hypothetical protein
VQLVAHNLQGGELQDHLRGVDFGGHLRWGELQGSGQLQRPLRLGAFLGRGKLQGHLELGGFLRNGQLGGHHERGRVRFAAVGP